MSTRLVSPIAASLVLLTQAVPGAAGVTPPRSMSSPAHHHQVIGGSTVPHRQSARLIPTYAWLGVNGTHFWSGALAGSNRSVLFNAAKVHLTYKLKSGDVTIAKLKNEINTITTQLGNQNSQSGINNTLKGELTTELQDEEKVLTHKEEQDGETDVNSEIATNATVQMDFGMLPPEVNSGLVYSGPGAAPMVAAATAWDSLSAELQSAATSQSSVISGLTNGLWQGPTGATMSGAAAPYQSWLSASANQAGTTAGQAKQSAAAYETAFAQTVPPPVIAGNRSQLQSLVATNFLGQNTPAIAANEAQYGEMWAQDVAAMTGYHAGMTAPAPSTTGPVSVTTPATSVVAPSAKLAAPTTGVVPAAADEVSSLIAAQFANQGQQYQAVNAQAAGIHEQFVQTLGNNAGKDDVAIAIGGGSTASASGAGTVAFADVVHSTGSQTTPVVNHTDAQIVPPPVTKVATPNNVSANIVGAMSEPVSADAPAPALNSLTPGQVEQIAAKAGAQPLTDVVDNNHIVNQAARQAQNVSAEQLKKLTSVALARLVVDVPGQALFAAATFDANELNALSKHGVVFGRDSNANSLDLVKGFVLFAPSRDISVRTHEALVSIPRGTAVWVMETGNDVAIFDFHDSHATGPVKVIAHDRPIVLSPGMQALLTTNGTAAFDSVNPANGVIGYRNVRPTDAGGGIKAYVCDFSLPDGMINIQFLHAMLMSKNPTQQKLAHNILKNAAILADLTGFDYSTTTVEK